MFLTLDRYKFVTPKLHIAKLTVLTVSRRTVHVIALGNADL